MDGFQQVCCKIGRTLDPEPSFKTWAKGAGFTHVKEKRFKLPAAGCPKDPRLREIDVCLSLNFSDGVKVFTAVTFTDILGAFYSTGAETSIASAIIQPVRRAAEFPSASARILLGHPGSVSIADFHPGDTNKLFLSLDKEVVGIPSWMAFASPNRLYAVDESSATLRLFELDLEKDKLTLKAEKDGSYGVVHLQFNADKTGLIGSAYGNRTIDI
ncbi:hypothetical protein QQZ08_009382 [Neonectria magnoliae]|uniref:Uncharacterized protein n=1 Tax=Neonectria magnoliae TaxID=2732573 RepID=A0ABR1HNL5_9HYPO